MTGQDQIGAQRNQEWKEHEGMFRGATIRELTGLVDAVMRTYKTPSCIAASVTVTPDPTPNVMGVGNPVADCLEARSSRMPVILAP
jgi:hypothetical protein